jgi:rhamnosyltransferase
MVSVIIPTYNAGTQFNQLLCCLESQQTIGEIIVIDSSSTDCTVDLALSHGIVPIRIDKKDFNHGGTRNMAARRAKGDRFVFLTQDCLPRREDCIARLIEPLDDPSIVAAFGRHVPREGASLSERYSRMCNYPESSSVRGQENARDLGIKNFFFSNVCSAIRKKEFVDHGGFCENLMMFEDMLFAAKLMLSGYRVAYVPEAEVIHSHSYSMIQHFRRYAAAGVSFRKNGWFLEYARSGKSGLSYLLGEVRYFSENGAVFSIPSILVEAFFKYSGYMLGLNYHRMPKFLSRYLESGSET